MIICTAQKYKIQVLDKEAILKDFVEHLEKTLKEEFSKYSSCIGFKYLAIDRYGEFDINERELTLLKILYEVLKLYPSNYYDQTLKQSIKEIVDSVILKILESFKSSERDSCNISKYRKMVFDKTIKAISSILTIEKKDGRPITYNVDSVFNRLSVYIEYIIRHYPWFGMDDKQCLLLKQLYKKFYFFSEEALYPDNFDTSPEWKRINDLAKEIETSFDSEIPTLDKAKIKEEFFKTISHIADLEFQKKFWLQEEPEEYTITDTFLKFLYNEELLRDYKDFEIDDEQYNLLLQLNEKMKAFWKESRIYHAGRNYPENPIDKLIAKAEWLDIVELAKKIMQKLAITS